MTKKDFQLIADVLRNAQDCSMGSVQRTTIDILIEDFADALKQTNPLFKKDKFMRAAGFSQG